MIGSIMRGAYIMCSILLAVPCTKASHIKSRRRHPLAHPQLLVKLQVEI